MQDSEFIVPGQPIKDVIIPRFFKKHVKNSFKSEKEGRTIYDEFDYVELLTPGDTRSIPVRKVKEEDKARWHKQWAAYDAGKTFAPDGMPLEMWPPIDINQIEHLKHFNVRTVEQLAALGDNVLGNLGMGARALRDKAKVWLAEAQQGSGLSKVLAENNKMREEMAAMQEQMRSLLDSANRMKAEAEQERAMHPQTAGVQLASAALDAATISQMVQQQLQAALANFMPQMMGPAGKAAETFAQKVDEAIAKPPAPEPKPAPKRQRVEEDAV